MLEEQHNQYPGGSLQPVQQQMTFGMDAAGVGGFALPAALLAQYPALNNIDWSAMPQGEDPGEMSDVGVGRSSFDASSGGEFYDEDDIDNGYVSGSGMTFNHSGQGAW
jgi:transcription factor CRZ1